MIDDAQLVSGLKRAMDASRVTLRELSRQTEVPYRSLQNYMSGRSRLPADVYVALCAALGIDTQYVVQGSFQLPIDPLYDVLWRVLGDGLLTLEAKPTPPAPTPSRSTIRSRRLLTRSP